VLLELVGEGLDSVKDGRVRGHELAVRLRIVLRSDRRIGRDGSRGS
jgi:hypothetical protein